MLRLTSTLTPLHHYVTKIVFAAVAECPSFHSQFLDHLECTNNPLLFCIFFLVWTHFPCLCSQSMKYIQRAIHHSDDIRLNLSVCCCLSVRNVDHGSLAWLSSPFDLWCWIYPKVHDTLNRHTVSEGLKASNINFKPLQNVLNQCVPIIYILWQRQNPDAVLICKLNILHRLYDHHAAAGPKQSTDMFILWLSGGNVCPFNQWWI